MILIYSFNVCYTLILINTYARTLYILYIYIERAHPRIYIYIICWYAMVCHYLKGFESLNTIGVLIIDQYVVPFKLKSIPH